jgi:hypothetical protein
MLRGTLGWRRMKPARSGARIIWWTDGGVTPKCHCVEPMAAVTAPARTAAQNKSLLHFVGEGSPRALRVCAFASPPRDDSACRFAIVR